MEEPEASDKTSPAGTDLKPSTRPIIERPRATSSWLRENAAELVKRISFVAVVGFLSWLFANRPVVLIESQAALNPKDVHGSVIVIKNAGQLWASSVTATCVVREVEYESGHELHMWGIPVRRENTFKTASIAGGDQISIQCPEYVSLMRKPIATAGFEYIAGFSSNERPPAVDESYTPARAVAALAEVVVTYSTPWWSSSQQRRHCLAKKSFEDKLIWMATADSVKRLPDDPPMESIRFKVSAKQDSKNPDAYSYEMQAQIGDKVELVK